MSDGAQILIGKKTFRLLDNLFPKKINIGLRKVIILKGCI